MKKFTVIFLSILCSCLNITVLHAQSCEEEIWQIKSVKETDGPSVDDMKLIGNSLCLKAVHKGDTLDIENFNTFLLSQQHEESDGFIHRTHFRFKDQYNQSGKLILHFDPTATESDDRYLIFILYDKKSTGRVLISDRPYQLDNEEIEAVKGLFTTAMDKIINTIIEEPNYSLKGRTVVGSLVQPVYASKSSGKVVVEIKVDGKGNVIEANAGAKGTTVNDKNLWSAAIKAAKATHFTPKSDNTPQWGTITYVFEID